MDKLEQVEAAVRFKLRDRLVFRALILITRGEPDQRLFKWFDGGIGVMPNRGIQNRASILVAVGRNIRTSPGKTDSQRGSGSN
jgi:hypothetical protein